MYQKMTMPDHLLNREAVCKLIDVAPKTVNKFVDSRGFPRPVETDTRRRYWLKADVMAWLEKNPRWKTD